MSYSSAEGYAMPSHAASLMTEHDKAKANGYQPQPLDSEEDTKHADSICERK